MSAIAWNTVPDYDEWGFDEKWSCDQWIQWHKALKTKFGSVKANNLWSYAFSKSGQFSENLDCRTFNSSFRQYVRDNNLDTNNNYGIFGVILNPAGSVLEISNNVLDGLTDFAGSNTVKKVLTAALILGVGFLSFKAYQTYKK